jgi:hypothetical protein
VRFYLKKKKKYPSQKRAGGVAQGVGLKVKLQYSKKKKSQKTSINSKLAKDWSRRYTRDTRKYAHH